MAESVLSTEQQIASIWALGGLQWRELVRRVWGGIDQTDLINRAYELAYNFLLAVFPLLVFLVTLFGIFASGASKLSSNMFFFVQQALPPVAYRLLMSTLSEVNKNAAGKLTFGLLFALYTGSGGMTQLISTLNAAYEVRETRPWWRVRLISLGLTIALSVLSVIALLFVFGGKSLIVFVGSQIGLATTFMLLSSVLQWTLGLVFVVIAFATVYYFGPDVREQHWYWITPGSIAGVVLWALASAALRAYLRFFDTYSTTYGSLGAVIVLMLWFYVTGLAFLIGGQINSTIEHAAAEHGHLEAKPAGAKAA
jgi:membrane protein